MQRLVCGSLDATFRPAGAVDGAQLMALLDESRPDRPRPYNVVLTRDTLTFVQDTPWLISKHALASHYADACFAGAMWKDALGRLHVSAASGTYLPSPETLERAMRFFDALLPEVERVEERSD
jgi:hypothetical protein